MATRYVGVLVALYHLVSLQRVPSTGAHCIPQLIPFPLLFLQFNLKLPEAVEEYYVIKAKVSKRH
jgi:hypothetical protein